MRCNTPSNAAFFAGLMLDDVSSSLDLDFRVANNFVVVWWVTPLKVHDDEYGVMNAKDVLDKATTTSNNNIVGGDIDGDAIIIICNR